MAVTFHPPTRVSFSGELPEPARRAIAAAAIEAVSRAIDLAVATSGMEPAAQIAPAAPILEPFDEARFDQLRGTYRIPSYDKDGEPTTVDVENLPPPEVVAEDAVLAGASPLYGAPILILPGNTYIYLRSERYAVASNLLRAVQLGVDLFGTTAFAIMEGPIAEPTSRYWVLGTDTAITEADIGPPATEPIEVKGGRVAGYSGRRQLLLDLEDREHRIYLTRAFVTKDRKVLLASFPLAERWFAETGGITKGMGLAPEQQRQLVFPQIDELVDQIKRGDATNLQEAARLISQLDVMAFRLVSWETKVEYIKVLLAAWTWEEEEVAIVQIFKSLRNGSEVDAVVAMLKQAGRFDQLFNDLDSKLWDLLVTVGEQFPRDPGPLTFKSLIELLQGVGLIKDVTAQARAVVFGPAGLIVDGELLAEAEEAALSFVRFVGGIAESIWTLVSDPAKVAMGVAQLVKMIVMVNLATMGYPPALEYVAGLLKTLATKVLHGLRGAERLGAGDKVVRRIRWALVWEIASLFIGVGEIKAAIESIGISEKLAEIARFLAALTRIGEVADAEVITARLTRLAKLLNAERAVFAGEGEVVTLLSHLPDRDVSRLARLLGEADVEVREGEKLAELAARHTELGKAAEDALAKVEVLKTMAAKAGGLTEEVAEAFRIMAGSQRLEVEQVARIARAIPEGEGARFAAMVKRVPLDRIGREGEASAAFLESMAGSARRMNAVTELGYGTMEALYRRAGGRAGDLEEHLGTLARMEERLAAEGKAADYRRLLDRLERDDPAAWVELEDFRRVGAGEERLAPYLKSAKATRGIDTMLRKGHRGMLNEILDAPDEVTALMQLETVGELTERQVDGLAVVRDLESGEVHDWSAVFDLEAAHRTELLDLVAEVKGSVTEGMDRAVAKALQGDVTGSLGQFQAVHGLQNRFGTGARFRLEISKAGAGGVREVDIEMLLNGRTFDVEVKAYAKGTPFKAEVREQMSKDLLAHFNDPQGPWTDMLWRLDPEKANALQTVERYMTEELEKLFRDGKLPGSLDDAKAILNKRFSDAPPWRLVDVIQF